MATLTIRNLDESAKQALRERAAKNGRSMEEEMRVILTELEGSAEPDEDEGEDATRGSLYKRVRASVEPLGGIELDLPPLWRHGGFASAHQSERHHAGKRILLIISGGIRRPTSPST